MVTVYLGVGLYEKIGGASSGDSGVAHASHHDSPQQIGETENIGLLSIVLEILCKQQLVSC